MGNLPALTDVEWIFVVVAVLYLIELVFWLPRGSSVFTSRWSRFVNLWPRRPFFGNDRGGLYLSGSTPLDAAIVATPLPFSIGREGLVRFVTATLVDGERLAWSQEYFTWEQLASVRTNDKQVVCDRRIVCEAYSAALARATSERLTTIAQASLVDRARLIEAWVKETYSVEAFRERFEQWREATQFLRFAAVVLMGWIFIVGGAIYARLVPGRDSTEVLIGYLAFLFALWWFDVLLVFRAHRHLAAADRIGRWKLVFMSLVSPVVVMRAADHLLRDSRGWLHPLTVVAAFANNRCPTAYASATYRDLEHSIVPEVPESLADPAQRAVAEFHLLQREMFVQLCRAQGWKIAELATEPERLDADSMAYCPRCLREFSRLDVTCQPCGHLAPEPFSSAS